MPAARIPGARLPGLILTSLLLLLLGAPPAPARQAPAQPTLPPWRATGIAVAETYQALCVDAYQPDTVLLAVEGIGTVAYNWRTGARTVAYNWPFDECTASGPRFAGYPPDPRPPGGPTLPGPHIPTHWTAADPSYVYAIPAAGQTEFWASADGGQTWQPRHLPDAPIREVIVAQADARVLYALYTSADGTGCSGYAGPQVSVDYRLYASEDTGRTWELRRAGTIPPESGLYKTVRLEDLPGVNLPRGAVLRTMVTGGCSTNFAGRAFYLSTDGGRTFEELGTLKRYSGGDQNMQLLHTSAGLLRWASDTGATYRRLEFRTAGSPSWLSVAPDFPRPQFNPWATADLRVVPAAPAVVFLGTWGSRWYTADGGRQWQPWTGNLDFGASSPYLPLTLVTVHDGQLYVRDLPAAAASLALPVVPSQVPEATYFPETGHHLAGVFARYWAAHGGLPQFGYPLTDPFRAVSPIDGRIYLVQYFERNRFEWHPEAAGTPAEVQLGLLGAEVSAAQRASGALAFSPMPDPRLPGVDYFAPTGHTLRGAFRAYWTAHGGLPLYGYPLSEEFAEPGEDGRRRTVQYFERAIFEHHPENAPPYDILLRRLGATAFAQWAAAPTAPAAVTRTTDLLGIALAGPGDGWIVGREVTRHADGTTSRRGVLWRYDGRGWRPAPAAVLEGDLENQPLQAVVMAGPTDGWAVGAGVARHYLDGRWRAVQDVTVDLADVALAGGEAGAVGQQAGAGRLLRCAGRWCYGAAGSALPALGGLALWPTGEAQTPAAGWAVGAGGALVRYPAGETVPGPVTRDLASVSMAASDDGWAVGASGTILHFDGTRWAETPGPVTADLTRVRTLSASEAWAVGAGGTILHYSGGVWWAVPSPTAATLRDVAFSDPAHGWVVGDGGTLLRYDTGTWRVIGP
jgi:photosystem II stability/assembly factor-like uncharacterized protein